MYGVYLLAYKRNVHLYDDTFRIFLQENMSPKIHKFEFLYHLDIVF